MKEAICLSLFIFMSALFAIIMIAAGFLCEYRKKTKIKTTVYECGIEPFEGARTRFQVKYFNYAILFLIFDVETIFLYPLAVDLNSLGIFAVFEAFIFFFFLLSGLGYAVKKKFLRWI